MSNLNQLLINVIRVPAAGNLAPGASVTINPQLFSNQKPVVPTLIQPDRGTPIVIDTTQPITATSVTFKNNDPAAPAFAYFRFERGVSVEVDAAALTTSYWQGVTAAAAGGFTAVNAAAPIASSNPGGPVTTISLNPSGVTADTYGDNSVLLDESKMPIVTVTAEGLVSSASEESIRIGGDPAKTYVDNAASTAETNAKNYAEQLAFGISSKDPVHAATVAALPAYTGTAQVLTATANGPIPSATTDSHTLLLNERLLVKDEAGANEKYNGIYELTQVGDGSNPWILTRTADANTDDELCGSLVTVQVGAVNAGTLWIFAANPATFTIGSSPVIWDPITFPNATTGAPGAVQLVDGLGGNFSAYNAPRLDADFINKGTLAVAHGGTGTNALTARAALVANATGTAVAGVSPGALGNVMQSDGTDWTSGPVTIPPVTVARNYYVTVDGNDTTGDGSLSAPYATIQKAHDEAVLAYPAGEKVVISVGPGNFATGVQIIISRFNTFIIGQGARPEDQVTKIADPISVDCGTATDLYNQQVGIDGCYAAPGSGFTAAAIEVTGASPFSAIITNCYATTNNAAATASAIACYNPNARIVAWNCIATIQSATPGADIVFLDGGNHRIADTQILHGSLVGAGFPSVGLRLTGASYLFADRITVETRTATWAVEIDGAAYGALTAKAIISNAGITNTTAGGGGISAGTTGLSVLLTDVFFTIRAASTCISSSGTTPLIYGQLSFAPTLSTITSIGLPLYTNELHGEMYLNALTASLPLKLNASKKVISQAIALASEVSGVLPVANGGTNISSYTAGDLLYATGATTLTKLPIGNVNEVLSVSAGLLPVWSAAASGTVTSVTSTNALLSVATGTTTPALTINTGTTGSTVAIGNDARFNVDPSAGNGRLAVIAAGAWSTISSSGDGYVLRFNSSTGLPAWSAGVGTTNMVFLYRGIDRGEPVSVTPAAATTIPVTSPVIRLGGFSGTLTMSATPQIQTAAPIDSATGARLTIINDSATTGAKIVFTDDSVLAGSAVKVASGTTLTIAQYQAVDFIFDGTYWIERAVPSTSLTGIPYDLAAEVAGTPGAGDTVMRFVACRAFTMSTSGNASCATAPSANTDFDVLKNGSSIGTIQYTNAGVTGTVTITVATAFAAGDILTVVAPAGLNGLDSPFFTFNAVL